MPTISGLPSASAASACPNGAERVRWPGSASDAIIADVVSLADVLLLGCVMVASRDVRRLR